MRKTALLALLAAAIGRCSFQTMAVNQIGSAIAGGGTTFSSDDDARLVGDALPFSLKLMEGLLEKSPQHTALLVAAASGFTQYAYGWVASEGDDDPATRERSRRLYLRARDYGLRALSVSMPDMRERLAADPRGAVAAARKRDVPALYWTAASWALAISIAKDDPELLGDLPVVEALIFRAAELDPGFEHGAIDEFLITYEAARSGVSKDADRIARQHFRRAVELSGGHSASPFVTAAEALAVPAQDRREFESLLKRALSVDPDTRPEWRLANIVSQRRAGWLLEHEDDFFMKPITEDTDEP